MSFRKDFLWGTATASYQVEGAAYRDGKGLQIWDVFCKTPGKILDGSSGDRACEHYDRYKEDVKLMASLGIKAYRFSISWARILPDGTGAVNQKGLGFYGKLIDELLTYGIEPCITLYHWDLPYELYIRGGWMNPDIVKWFAEYARIVVEAFSDKVSKFITFNEPQCFIGLSHVMGEHAPGLKNPLKDTFLMAHHVLMAHGAAVQAMRAAAKRPVEIGYAPTGAMYYPATQCREDIEAARIKTFSTPENADNWSWNIGWWSDPVMLGSYPEDGMERYREYLPRIGQGDLELMCQPIDFYGQNIYNGQCIKAGKDGGPVIVDRETGAGKTAAGWPVTPECLYWVPRFLYERYKKPIYITENGLSCHDVVSLDGKVHDPNRIDFTARYLRELKRAAEDGVDIRGYFHWSLMDNFEWAKGYTERFGLIYVDYASQERILKDSAYWYKEVIADNGERL